MRARVGRPAHRRASPHRSSRRPRCTSRTSRCRPGPERRPGRSAGTRRPGPTCSGRTGSIRWLPPSEPDLAAALGADPEAAGRLVGQRPVAAAALAEFLAVQPCRLLDARFGDAVEDPGDPVVGDLLVRVAADDHLGEHSTGPLALGRAVDPDEKQVVVALARDGVVALGDVRAEAVTGSRSRSRRRLLDALAVVVGDDPAAVLLA